jgi:hypothetical protein
MGVQDPGNITRTEAATLQAVVDEGLKAHSFEPSDPAIQMHITQKSGNPHEVTADEVGSPPNQELSDHVSDTNNPHDVTPDDVGNQDPEWNAGMIQDVPVSGSAPALGQALVYNGTEYEPGDVASTSPDYVTFVPQDPANMPDNALFLDSITGKLSYKDNTSTVRQVAMGDLGANQAPYTDDDGMLTGLDIGGIGSQVIKVSVDGKHLEGITTGKFELPIAWIVFDDSEAVASIVGEQPLPIPQSPLSGYQFVDVMVRCATPASGSLVVDILKNGTSMMDTPILLTNTQWVDMASGTGAVIKDPPESLVARGDAISYTATLTGAAPSGLSIMIVLKAY